MFLKRALISALVPAMLGILPSILGVGSRALASDEPYRRLVNFEWEPVEDASAFEIEIKQEKKEDGKIFKFKVKEAAWNGRLTPGKYTMKLRALDRRGVAGDWSEPSPFDVGLESAKLVYPAPRSSVASRESEEASVEFKWEPVGGAKSYQIEITSDDGKFKKDDSVSGTSVKFTLPVARPFTWKVAAVGANDTHSEAVSIGQFNLLGTKVAKPKIEKPENQFVRELKWKKQEFADTSDVTLARLNPATKKWEKFQSFQNFKGESLNFEEKWPGGDYKVMVRSKAELRMPSDVASESFKVRNGSRTPAAEFTAEVRKSIDRINGWYGIASYLITQLNYSMQDYDTTQLLKPSYQAIGGTGRLGLGYFKEDKPWGFLSIIDMSGFLMEDGTRPTAMSMEGNAVYRVNFGERGEVRTQFGVLYKELQITIGRVDQQRNQTFTYDTAAYIGPHVGGEYWYSLTPKLGFQINAHLYMSLLKVKMPAGGTMTPATSTQFGFLGSYRFNKRFTGLMGYAKREDRVKYSANPIIPQFEGATNEVTLSGEYLNFFAEYAF